MYKDNPESAYFEMRVGASLQMARAATSCCARMVHEELADRYRDKAALLRGEVPSAIADTPKPLSAAREVPYPSARAAA